MKRENVIKYSLLMKEGNYRQVISDLEKFKNSDSDNFVIYFLISAYRCIGKHKEADYLINNSNVRRDKLLLIEAEIAKENCNIGKSEAILKRLINTTADVAAYNELAKIYFEKGNIDEAELVHFEALKLYNDDVYALNGLGKIELRRGNLKKAKYYYNSIIEIAEKEKAAEKNKNIKNFKIGYRGLLYTEIKRGDYEKSYYYLSLLANCENTAYQEIRRENVYLKEKLGLLSLEEKNSKNLIYHERQIINYDRNLTIQHIKEHKNYRLNKQIHSVFCKNVDICELLDIAFDRIKDLDPVECTLNDNYVIEFDSDIGIINGVLTNKLLVVTQSNNYNIITLYPVASYFESFNANKKNDYTGHQKVRKSQIEKFNEKYNSN